MIGRVLIHIRYNEYRASMDIRNLNIIVGSLPAKVRGLVEEWAEMHQEELLTMRETKTFHKIKPLVSTFATIRYRTARTKGCVARDSMLHMMFKLGDCISGG